MRVHVLHWQSDSFEPDTVDLFRTERRAADAMADFIEDQLIESGMFEDDPEMERELHAVVKRSNIEEMVAAYNDAVGTVGVRHYTRTVR